MSPSALLATCVAIECEARAAEAALGAAPADASTLAAAARLRESIAAGRPWLVKNGVQAVVLTGDEGLAPQRRSTAAFSAFCCAAREARDGAGAPADAAAAGVCADACASASASASA